MIELLSVGDRVPIGRYRPFSRFTGALNFVRRIHRPGLGGPILVCVVSEEKGAGPLNVVVRGDLSEIRTLEVRAHEIRFNEAALPIRMRWHSGLRVPPKPDLERFAKNLALFERRLLESAPLRSFACALNPLQEHAWGQEFEKLLLRAARGGVERLLDGDFRRGARALRGLGSGLTPAGDDFLAGFLLGLRISQQVSGKDFSSAIRQIRRGSRSRNLFSESFLRCAACGHCFERANALVEALFEGSPAQVESALLGLLAVGATSGADLAAGLLAALTRTAFASPTPRVRGELTCS